MSELRPVEFEVAPTRDRAARAMGRVAARHDVHHLLHDRISWESRDTAKALRRNPSLMVRMDRDTHQALHDQTPIVPLLSYHMLRRTLSLYEPGSNTLKSMEHLQQAITRAGEAPKAHFIEVELGQLACHVLDLEKDFVRQGEVFLPRAFMPVE